MCDNGQTVKRFKLKSDDCGDNDVVDTKNSCEPAADGTTGDVKDISVTGVSDAGANNYTDTPGESTARCRQAVRRWGRGDYTLLHDTDNEGSEYALDAMLFFACQGQGYFIYPVCYY